MYYINKEQNNQVKWLLLAKLVYNNTKHESTGIILFETDYGYNPSLYRLPKDGKPKVERALMIESRARVIKEKLR